MHRIVFGKCEGKGEQWHGHLSAISVAPQYRKQGIATQLMGCLEQAADQGDMYFVDLFVRVSNTQAIKMYERLGYSIYRRVLEYYTGPDEDAYDMRKAMKRDVSKKSIVPLRHPVHWENLERW